MGRPKSIETDKHKKIKMIDQGLKINSKVYRHSVWHSENFEQLEKLSKKHKIKYEVK